MALEWLGYVELINTFSFREKCSIKIPKSVRERAFSLQLDIEIQSTAGNDYVNSKSIPAYGFYGYVVLVMRDFSKIQIPVNQPRQVLYYERIEEAYANWYNLFLFQALREWSKGLADVIGQIGEAVGLGDYTVPPAACLPWGGFEEIPLREVYVKTPFGTRFSLEISHWRPVTRTGDTDCDYDPTSQQVDGDKDDGLPPDGAQPSNNGDPTNPYSGYPPPSSPSDLGDWNNNSKLGNVDNPNPDNESGIPVEPNEGAGTYIVYSWTSTSVPPSTVPPVGFPNFEGYFLFDSNPANIYTTGDRCDSDAGISYFRNGSPLGCAAASGYRLESLAFPRFF